MTREYSPIDIGLDALGVSEDQNPVIALALDGKSANASVALVSRRMNKALKHYPEIRSDILVAGMEIMLDQVNSVEEVLSLILPHLDRVVDQMAA